MTLWTRYGDRDDYRSNPGINEAAQRLADQQLALPIARIGDMSIQDADGVYISAYWGDDHDAGDVERPLTPAEYADLDAALAVAVRERETG